MRELKKRSMVKAFSWRVIATLTTMGIVLAVTRRLDLSLSVGALDLVAKMVFYYAHERIWSRIAWGRVPHPLSVFPVTSELTPQDMRGLRKKLEELGYL